MESRDELLERLKRSVWLKSQFCLHELRKIGLFFNFSATVGTLAVLGCLQFRKSLREFLEHSADSDWINGFDLYILGEGLFTMRTWVTISHRKWYRTTFLNSKGMHWKIKLCTSNLQSKTDFMINQRPWDFWMITIRETRLLLLSTIICTCKKWLKFDIS